MQNSYFINPSLVDLIANEIALCDQFSCAMQAIALRQNGAIQDADMMKVDILTPRN